MTHKITLIEKYYLLIDKGKINFDPLQKDTLQKLNQLSLNISSQNNKGFIKSFVSLVNKNQNSFTKGIYIWGGVGRGKSMLMDLFFNHVSFKSKKRTHFHNFMAETHDLIHSLRKNKSINNIPDHASEIISKVFGEKGLHTRAAVSSNSLPLGVAVEVDAIFELNVK